MSTTRYADPGGPEAANQEANLASRALRGIAIGTQIVAAIARVLPQSERDAMLWLCAYARLRDLTQDAVADELDLDPAEIRSALTDPAHDRTRFVRQVSALRAKFERHLDSPRPPSVASPFALRGKFDEALAKPADTLVLRKIGNAVKMALRAPTIIELLGKTRSGKSISARHYYLRNLHQAAWIHTPFANTDRDWLAALAGALGVTLGGTSWKSCQLRPKIQSCFGPNRIKLLFVDESHRLWPSDPRHKPSRIEELRDLWEMFGVSIIILGTDQYATAVETAMQHTRWAPGQWVGRVQPYDLPDTLKDGELRAIAAHHLPKAEPEVLDQLVLHAKTSEGYIGAMVAAIDRGIAIADGTPDLATIIEAQRLVDRQARAAALASAVTGRARLRPSRNIK